MTVPLLRMVLSDVAPLALTATALEALAVIGRRMRRGERLVRASRPA
jgi:hypothetical protein